MLLLNMSKIFVKLQFHEGGCSLTKWRQMSNHKVAVRPKSVPVLTSRNLQVLHDSKFVSRQVLARTDHELVKGRSKPLPGDLDDEIARTLRELERVVGRMREAEMERFFGRGCDGDVTLTAAEKMSEEIVAVFLEKPVRYLTSSCGNLEEKMRDVRLLIRMLDNSCPANIQQGFKKLN